jgi:hypothetical protein
MSEDMDTRQEFSETPSIAKWRNLIDQAQHYKEKYGNSRAWKRYRQYVRGHFGGYTPGSLETAPDFGILPYNVTYAQMNTLVPNIYYRNPYINITPRFGSGMDFQSKAVEGIINWLVHELDFKGTFKRAIKDCYTCGRGIIKCGYDSQYALDLENGRSRGELAQMNRKGTRRIQYNAKVLPGMPWLLRTNPDAFLVPFGILGIDDSPWLDHVILRNTIDLRNDPFYTNVKDVGRTHFNAMYATKNNESFYNDIDNEIDITEMHEIRDMSRGEVQTLVFGTQANHRVIRKAEHDPMQIDGPPFVDFTFNEDPEYYWNPSDAALLEPQQLELNDARTQAMRLRRLLLSRILVDEGMISDEEIAKMVGPMPDAVVRIKGTPNASFTQLNHHIPQDLLQWTNAIVDDVEGLTGIGKNQQGGFAGARTTATEVSQVAAGANLRLSERRDIVGDAIGRASRKTLQTIFKFWDQERVVEVVGIEGAKYWVSVTPSQLKHEYNLKVDVESLTPMSKEAKKRDILNVLQVVGNNPRVNVDYLMNLLLREYDWIDALKVLPEAPESQALSQQGQALPFNDFQTLQGGLAGNPTALGQRAETNANVLRGRLRSA